MNQTMSKIALLLLCLIVFGCSLNIKQEHPNIIIITAKNMHVQSIGSFNSTIKNLNTTPNLDSLVGNPSHFIFKTPEVHTNSKALSLLKNINQLDDLVSELPKTMKINGYNTSLFGYWASVNEPANFDFYKVLDEQRGYFNPVFRKKWLKKWPDNTIKTKGYSTDIITNSAISYLKRLDKSQPFFIVQQYNAPGFQYEYAPRYESYLEHETFSAQDSLLFKLVQSDQFNTDSVQTNIKNYLRCVKGIDDNLQRLFAYLKAEGLWEKTIIVYLEDQNS